MSYFSQEMKKAIAPQIRKVLKEYNMKGTIKVRNYSTLCVTLTKGWINLDLKNGRNQSGRGDELCQTAKKFFSELFDAMNGKGTEYANHDNSDIMTDYFDVGWYTTVSAGRWDKPYEVIV
mgnify:CR=1 FL=1